MNKSEIADIFIKAAFIDSRLPDTARPKKLRGQWIGGSLLTEEDQRKWIVREKTDQGPSKLHKGDDPIKDWWLQFWDDRSTDTSRKDIRVWELAMELVTLVADESNRRALWAWAASKVGSLVAHEVKTRKTSQKMGGGALKVHKRTSRNVTFSAWCKAEGIHEMTGMRRKDRAIDVILQYLVRGSSPDALTAEGGVLPTGPVFEHISDMIGAVASDHKGPTFERDRETIFAKEDAIFNWQAARNATRRQREAKRREQAA